MEVASGLENDLGERFLARRYWPEFRDLSAVPGYLAGLVRRMHDKHPSFDRGGPFVEDLNNVRYIQNERALLRTIRPKQMFLG